MKVGRQTKIIELINQYDVETQEELAERLNAAGYYVTQATISRDIREMKLTKVVSETGRQKYVVLQNQESGLYQKYVRVLKDCFVSMDKAGNILVIKTVSGMAMAVAVAVDNLQLVGVVGSIAGDDTIMCAIRNEDEVISVMEKLNKLLNAKV